MSSPFPGMDPYLEAHWGDIHHRLITYASDAIQPGLPSDLRARVEERVYLESPDGRGRSVYPDVRVIERPSRGETSQPEGGLAVAEPLVLQFPSEEITEGYIEIREAGTDSKVITIIEFVSMSNKQSGEGRDKYLQKQQECRAAGVNRVEIDLLRAGQRVFSFPEQSIPLSDRTPYRVAVWRACRPFQVEYYAIGLQQRLPAIGIPLRETDSDVALNLQAILDQAYRNGAYDDLDYTRDADPPLEGEDAPWADALLREKGLRK